MKNPQANFEDSIFGPHGMHPTPKSLPFPTRKIETIYGETIEYLVLDEQKEKVLKKLYPYEPSHRPSSKVMCWGCVLV